jgi:predicted nuclease with TOPRIM domain
MIYWGLKLEGVTVLDAENGRVRIACRSASASGLESTTIEKHKLYEYDAEVLKEQNALHEQVSKLIQKETALAKTLRSYKADVISLKTKYEEERAILDLYS